MQEVLNLEEQEEEEKEEDIPPELENIDLEAEREKKKLEWIERLHSQEVERANNALLEAAKAETS